MIVLGTAASLALVLIVPAAFAALLALYDASQARDGRG